MAQNNTPTNTPATNPQATAPAADNAAAVNVSASGAAPATVKGVDMGMIVDKSGPNINPAALDSSAAIQTREARVEQDPNFGKGPGVAAKNGAIGYTAMNFGKVENLNKPAAGQTVTVTADAGEQFKVNFDPNAAQLSVRNGDLIFTFNDGAQIVVDHFVMASNQMPSLMLPDGTLLAGGVVVAQLTGKSADDLFNIETAAGPAGAATGSGGFVYNDYLGDVIDLLDKLPPILFSELAFPAPTDRPAPFLQNPDFAPGEQPNINDLVDETGGYGVGGVNDNNERTGVIVPDFGRDGAGSIALQPGFTYDGSVAGGKLTSHGSPVTTTFENGMVIGKDAAGHTIFTMEVKPDGTYNFKLLGQLDHADTANPNDQLDLHFTYVVSDKDGDQAIGNITIGVRDDAPVANPDVNNLEVTVYEYNVIGGAPDFPTLQEQKNLPNDRPDLYQQGIDKASNVLIDKPTTITIDRFQSPTVVAGASSPLFAFTQDANGNITNIQLIFGNGTANPDNNSPASASYQMTTAGKLGFFIASNATGTLKDIGAIDASGKIQPGFAFTVKEVNGKYDIQYTHNGQTKSLGSNAFFAGDFKGQDVQGVAGRQDGDGNNVLRYGFEDLVKNQSDQDYNDVQFKVTVNPTTIDTAQPISGNVLNNDVVGQDPMHSGPMTKNSVVTRVALENGSFKQFDQPADAGAAKGKFMTVQGEYGILKIYENGDYTYKYNTGKKDGDLTDVFRYTMRDQDGDTSTTTLTIKIGVDYIPAVSALGGSINEEALLVPGADTITRDITINSTDGVNSVKLTTDGLPTLSADGKPVVYTVTPDGKTLTGSAGGKEVFTVKLGTPVTQPDGTVKVPYTFELKEALDNPGAGENITNIPVKVEVTDKDGDKVNTTLPLQVIDDLPVAQNDAKGMGTMSVATGNIITNDSFGADGPAANAPKVTSISYGNETKTFANENSVVSFTTPKGTLEIKADGSYTFTRNPTLGELNETFNYSIKDADGDVSTAKLVITGNDNPVVITTPDPQNPGANGNAAVLDEDDLPVPGTDSVTKDIKFTAPDGVDTIKMNTSGLPNLTSDGKPVTYTVSADGKTLTGSAGGAPVFTVVIGAPVQQPDKSYTAPYTFTLLKPLDNPGAGENVTNIPVKFVVTDKDGDNATSTLPLQVIDDVPVAVNDAKAMGTTSIATGNIITNDSFGADGQAPNVPKINSISYGAETKTFSGPDATVSFTTPSGILSIKADGSYTFTRNATLGELNETFNYSIKDEDGDVSTAKLVITGNDNPVTITGPDPLNPYANGSPAVLDEDDLPVPGTDSVVKDISFTAPDGVDTVKMNTSGLPALTSNGQPVTYAVSADGKTLTGSAGGQTVFTVVIGAPVQQQDKSYKASYTFTLLQPLTNPGTGENSTNIPVKFVVTDKDGDNATGTLPLQVIDDVPVAANDSKAMGTSSVATGNIITNDNFGADGATPNAPKVTSISYGAETKTFAGPDSSVSFTTPSGTLAIKADGSYTFTRNASLGELNVTFDYKITDRDGDTSNAKLVITGNDNPVVITGPDPLNPYANGSPAVLDEDDLPVPGTDSVVKDISFTAPDGVDTIKLNTNGLPNLTSDGKSVTYTVSADGKSLTGSAGGQTVFTVAIGAPVQQPDKSYKAQYTFTLLKPLDNPGAGENSTNIPVKFVVTDKDGDNATGTLPLQVIDDVPVAVNDSKAMGTSSIATGNIISNDSFGADGQAPNVPKINSISYGAETKTFAGPDSVVSFTTPSGKLDIKADGSYTFTRNASLGNLNETFNYSIKDEDGDISNAKLVITGNDNPVVITGPDPLNPYGNGSPAVLDEDDLPVPGTDSVVKDVIFTAPDGVESVKMTKDGLPALTAQGQTVAYTLSADGKTLTGTAAGQTIFTVVLGNPVQQPDNSYKAQYTFTLLKPLDNPGNGENITNIPVKFIATDTDGDSATGTLPLRVIDDVPLARDDANSVADHGSVNGNVITGAGQNGGADTLSADNPNKIFQVVGPSTYVMFADVNTTEGGVKFTTIDGRYGQLKIFENGTYTYTHTKGAGSLVDQFGYVLIDKDGDTSQADLTINIQNGVPTIPAVQGDKISDETTDINVSINGTVSYTNASSVALGNANGSAGFAADGSLTGGKLTSNGADVHVALIGGKYVGYTGSDANASGAKVFELTMNGSQYSFKQFSNLDHANGSDPNDVINLKFAITAKDSDGDTATGQLNIAVRDDAPIANPDTNQAVTIIREFNVIGGAPDFPTLQEQKNLPKDRPDLYQQGTDKASNVNIDLPTTVTIERLKSTSEVSIVTSPLFAFTQDANGKITNIKLIFGVASANPDDNGPQNATYEMTSGGKLGFFIAGAGTDALKGIGAIDANGNIQPGFTFSLKEGSNGKYDIQYTHNGETKTLYWDNNGVDPLVARFAGDFLGQDVQGVAGRKNGDANNVLRYGFEDLDKSRSDEDYNDVQIKVTINPIITEVTDPIHGNVLPNDKVGQDDIQGLQYGTKLTQVAIGNSAFISFANPNGTDGGGKFINIQGEYGLLKMYENGQYTYQYNTDKKDGDMKDDFRYTIRDYDGDTSTTSLAISIKLDDQTKTVSTFASKSAEASLFATEEHAHDLNGKVAGDSVSYVLGHQGDASVFNTELTVGGVAVKAIVIGDTVHGFTGDAYNNKDVFTLTLKSDGNYAFDLHDKVDQGGVVSFDYTGKEVDGSAVESHLAIGIDGDKAIAVDSHSDKLNLADVLGPQGGSGSDSAETMNHVASIDIINDILSDDDPHNGYNG